jgi:hypothetical protein
LRAVSTVVFCFGRVRTCGRITTEMGTRSTNGIKTRTKLWRPRDAGRTSRARVQTPMLLCRLAPRIGFRSLSPSGLRISFSFCYTYAHSRIWIPILSNTEIDAYISIKITSNNSPTLTTSNVNFRVAAIEARSVVVAV